MSDPATPELEAWMRRNRARRTVATLETKVEAAERRGSRAILLPLSAARPILLALRAARL